MKGQYFARTLLLLRAENKSMDKLSKKKMSISKNIPFVYFKYGRRFLNLPLDGAKFGKQIFL